MNRVAVYALVAPPLYTEPRYIGVTRQPLKRRLAAHKREAIKHLVDTYKCRWMRKAVSEGCSIEIMQIGIATEENWQEAERTAIACYPNLTNSCDGGLTGRKVSAETRIKLSMVLKVALAKPEVRAKLSAAGKGRPKSEEHRKNISAALKGRVIDGEWAKKISAANLGRKHGPVHREKTSAAGRGRIMKEQTKEKLRIARLKYITSDETRAKMRTSSRIRWDRWKAEHGG